ncbi:MAG TPA: heme biosynthesis HemY N-terminal domain-containing protein, partial [Burkholderiales bacterium]|nr:heme biosynthesis HemY N-terminal domain-containing protein [Burkholderiales bacterium]
KALAWLLAVFAAAVALVILGRVDAGYALFVYPPYRVEMSMLLFVLALLFAFLLLYAVFRALSHALALPAHVRAFRARRRRERAHAALAAALQAYYEGRYVRAEKEAAEAFEGGQATGVAALLAARAAHQMRDFERRDRWLERAEGAGESTQAARLVSRAELALEERDYGAARDALRSLHGAGPKHIATSRMLLRAERGSGDWDEVLRLSTQLAKRDAIAPALAEEYKVQATVELLRRASADASTLERRWRSVPDADRTQPRIAAAAAQQAAKLGRAALARQIVEAALDAEWSPQLVALYGQLPERLDGEALKAEARARIERGERWLIQHERDAQLLATLGRLCAQAELWGKARSFLEASLSFEEGRAAHLDLARLTERIGQPADAQRHYRRAAELP